MPGDDPDRPQYATTKVFIRAGCSNGNRPLEPEEVVTLDKAEADPLLRKLGDLLTVTDEPATRPLVFSSQHEADMTSMDYNPATAGRAEEAKAAMKKIAEEMADGTYEQTPMPDMAELQASLDEREQAIIQREIELGIRTAPVTSYPTPEQTELETQLDADLQDYEPSPDNAVTRESIEEERKKAKAEAKTEAKTETKANPQTRRRRARSA